MTAAAHLHAARPLREPTAEQQANFASRVEAAMPRERRVCSDVSPPRDASARHTGQHAAGDRSAQVCE